MIEIESTDFDIEQIATSGQCFRMYQVDHDTWEVFALNKSMRVVRKSRHHLLYCSQDDFNDFWSNYFDLQTDYSRLKQRILASGDSYLSEAVRYGYGIRILQQDLWEVIVSFVISQQNNIRRISGCLKKLCEINQNKFPLPTDFLKFSNTDLDSVKLGYRKDYLLKISKAVVEEKFDINSLSNLSYPKAIQQLKTLHGVGDKVANCIVLFGLYKIEAFPVDVWIKKILQKYYDGDFLSKFPELTDIAGLVQQYMYFYERAKDK